MSQSENTFADKTLNSPDFECAVLDADSARLEIKGHMGAIIYVRLERGALPTPLRNCLMEQRQPWHPATWYPSILRGRPEKGAFAPVAATLSVPAGRVYPVNLIAALPPLSAMRPNLRAALNPPPDIDPEAIPVALEPLHLLHEFRPTSGRLVSSSEPLHEITALLETPPEIVRRAESQIAQLGWAPRPTAALPPDAVIVKLNHYQMLESVEGMELRLIEKLDPDARIEALLSALTHELGRVRYVAAHDLFLFAARLPVEPFLAAIKDTRTLNSAACMLAARVFGEHAEIVPLDAVLDIYHHARGFGVSEAAVWAMGMYGDRAPIALLEDLVEHGRQGIIITEVAARALGKLGAHAPINALIAEVRRGQGRNASATAAARALLDHPLANEVSDEERALAQKLVAAADQRQQQMSRLRDQPSEG